MKKNTKKLQYGAYSLIIAVAAIAVILLLNVAVNALDRSLGLSIDLTEEQMYNLSDNAKEVIKAVDEPTKLYYVQTPYTVDERIKHFLSQYTLVNPKITVEVIDPAADNLFVSQFDTYETGINSGSIIVSTEDHSHFRVLDINNDLTETDATYNQQYFIGEEVLTRAIKYLTDEASYNVYFVTGHGERDIDNSVVARLANRLSQDNYNVAPMKLSSSSNLKPNDVLIMLGPTQDITDEEREILKAFLENEGRLMLSVQPMEGRLENLYSLMEYFNLEIHSNRVVETDPDMYYLTNQYAPKVGNIKDVSKESIAYDTGLGIPIAIFPNTCTVGYTDLGERDRSFNEVLFSGPDSIAKSDISSTSTEYESGDQRDKSNGLLVSVYMKDIKHLEAAPIGQPTEVDNTRILLIGSTDFITTEEYQRLSYNKNFFVNGVHLLVGRDEDIGTSYVTMADTTLPITSVSQLHTINIVVIVVLPLIITAAGLAVWLRRRHL